MHNVEIYKSKIIRKIIEKSYNYLLYIFFYQLETNLLDNFLSQLKHYIKKNNGINQLMKFIK